MLSKLIVFTGYELELVEVNDFYDIKVSHANTEEQNSQILKEKITKLVVNSQLNNQVIDITKITSLTLSKCNLSSIPDCIEILNLRNLDLSHNHLTISPICLHVGLKSLATLNLSFNKIETILTDLACSRTLKKLNLSNNKFKALPNCILSFRCSALEELDFSNHNAQYYKFDCLSYYRSICVLRKLILRNSCLRDADFVFLKSIRGLNYLDLSNCGGKNINMFKDIDLLFTQRKWISLQVLVLDNISLGIFPEGIAWIEQLKELYIRQNHLCWIPSSLQYLINLEILDISFNDISAVDEAIFKLPLIRVVKARSNYINQNIEFEANLEILDLFDNNFEEFNCDISKVNCVDLESNYFDTRTNSKLQDQSYTTKLERFRRIDDGFRFNGPKEKCESNCSSSSERESEDDLNIEVGQTETIFEDNWDESNTSSPLITVSDNEYQGEKKYDVDFTKISQTRIYVNDEDWLYKDVD